jgi:hypothetical protein
VTDERKIIYKDVQQDAEDVRCKEKLQKMRKAVDKVHVILSPVTFAGVEYFMATEFYKNVSQK